MRTHAVICFALLLTTSAVAQESTPTPDYSPDKLRKTFAVHEITLPDRPEPNVKFRAGSVEFRALGMDWRFMYLPLAMPLSGTRQGITQEMPDPFALTGTAIATGSHAYPKRTRAVSRELRRIAKTERSRARLSARKQ